MENASKALIIAGSILISILVISLGVMIFTNMSNTVKSNANLNKQQIQAFNSKISPYIGKNISGSQVNELISRVRAINQKAKSSDDNIRVVTFSKNGIEDNNLTSVMTGKYYEVQGNYDENGLLTIINVVGPK